MDCQRLAELIVETGLPGTSDTLKGLKEGSYWQSIATKYENGVPGSRLVKAIYNVWRSKYFVDLVTKTPKGKCRISACCYHSKTALFAFCWDGCNWALRRVNRTVRFTLKLFLQWLKCHVISSSKEEMLTRASSRSKYTLSVLLFLIVKVLRWV